MSQLSAVKWELVIGQYAHEYRLGKHRKSSLTGIVHAWREFTPANSPSPHPSSLTNRWLAKNPWFTKEVIPYLGIRLKKL
ncbi:MAG: hypothetical protein VXZ82_21685 [Planctomycetota bacterium]|nr:hypothetical protein [Planctomycetota bacterium]